MVTMLSKVAVVAAFFLHLGCMHVRTESPNVSFMGRASRLHAVNYTDFYFSCHTIGEYIQWQYNEDPLSGFLPERIGTATVNNRGLSYEYTATLLSARPVVNNTRQAELVSLLVISFLNEYPESFTIKCGNNIEFTSTTTGIIGGTFTNVTNNTRRGNELALDYVFTSSDIVRSRKTHVFICGVQSMFQLIEVSGPSIGFSDRDNIGKVRTIFSDRETIDIQAILMDREPLQTTSLLIISENSEVIVRCSDEAHSVNLSSEAPTTPVLSTFVSTSLISTTQDRTSTGISEKAIETWIILFTIFVVLSIVAIAFSVIAIFVHYNRKCRAYPVQEKQTEDQTAATTRNPIVIRDMEADSETLDSHGATIRGFEEKHTDKSELLSHTQEDKNHSSEQGERPIQATDVSGKILEFFQYFIHQPVNVLSRDEESGKFHPISSSEPESNDSG